ncbi:transmembrane protein, putative (macronuclear) [Tetrahymena thermophila SB210]|uniref:Transmembrane protein, putative n=1 Tax=Tetrahymena thermophila (strain SB210) TaxID=312017 RepID=Q245R9_TETTS|nr:transmembrane protein, putative [Tetrahymena thermophila SB210]EAS03564.2 transmembrane protein, putative [Tetrahymena thermophila SB210]|eukprot:XP_001023809.2 transmembrane protein, putative [Tetrahymena thermophila SB210]
MNILIKAQSKIIEITQRTQFRIIFIVGFPQLLLLVIILIYINLNYKQSLSEVDEFSSNMYEQEIYLVQIQNKAQLDPLYQNIQHEEWVINLLQNLNTKMLNGQIIVNNKFISPILNIQNTYNNIGDSYLLNLYKKNSSYLVSSWHQKDTLNIRELNQLSLDQLRNASITDFFSRAALFANRLKQQQTNIVNIVDKSYFTAFNSDGMFFGAGANMTFQNITDPPPCQMSKYNMDSRCQGYFQDSMRLYQFPFVGYFPMLFMYDSNNNPYLSTGFCKKVYTPESFFQKYSSQLQSSFTQNSNIFSIVCQGIQVQQNIITFQNLGNNQALRILIEPITQSVVYQTYFQIQPNVIHTLNETYLYQLEEDQKILFLKQIQSFFYQNYILEECSFDKNYILNLNNKQKIGQFNFYQQKQEMVASLQFTYVIDKNIISNQTVKNQAQFCYLNNLLLITIMSKDQLQAQAVALGKQIEQVDLTFRILMYCIIFISIVITLYQSVRISKMINNSVEHLTDILKKIRVDEETKNMILFEDGIFSGDFEIDYSQLFLSSDMLLLYQSFQNLFQTLIFTTQNIFGQDQSLTLIELSKQIKYFRQIKNCKALGICYNNIGSIHFNNSRFLEALENFNQAIIYCKYEMSEFQDKVSLTQKSKTEQVCKNEQNDCQIKKADFCTFKYISNLLNILRKFFIQIRQKLKSKGEQMLQQNIQNQKDLINNLFTHRIDNQYYIQQEQNEFNQMLYNRKYNFLISLVYYNIQHQKYIWLWDTIESLVDELNNLAIPNYNLKLKMGILLNLVMMHIKFNKGDCNENYKVIENSEQLYEALKALKDSEYLQHQQIQQNDSKNQEQIKQAHELTIYETIENCSSYNINKASENNEQTIKFIKNEKQDHQMQYQLNSLSPIQNQSILTTQKPILDYLMSFQNQANSTYNPFIKNNSKTNLDFQSQQTDFQTLEFNSPIKNNKISSPGQEAFAKYPRKYFEKKQDTIQNESKSYFQNFVINLNLESQNQDFLNQKSIISNLNTPKSPKFQFFQENINYQLSQFTPKCIKQSSSQANLRKKSSMYLTRKKQNSFYDIQSTNKSKIIGSNNLHTKKTRNSLKQNLNQLDTQFLISSNSKRLNDIQGQPYCKLKNRKQSDMLSERLNNSSNFYLHGFGEDRNTYDLHEEAVLSFLMDQRANDKANKQNYYQAAEEITEMFEKCNIITPYQFNRSFKRLLKIFEQFKLNHKCIEQFYIKFVKDISFKICVLHIDLDSEDLQNTNKTVNQQINNNDKQHLKEQKKQQDLLEQLEEINQKERVVNLCSAILDKVIKKDDDYFGFLASSIRDMFIKQHISIINQPWIKRNVIISVLNNYIDQLETQNSIQISQHQLNKANKLRIRYMKSNEEKITNPMNQIDLSRIKSHSLMNHPVNLKQRSLTFHNLLQKQQINDPKNQYPKTTKNYSIESEKRNLNFNFQLDNQYSKQILNSPSASNFQQIQTNLQRCQENLINNSVLNKNINKQQINQIRSPKQEEQQSILEVSIDEKQLLGQKISSINNSQMSQQLLNNQQRSQLDETDLNENSSSQRIEKNINLSPIQEEVSRKNLMIEELQLDQTKNDVNKCLSIYQKKQSKYQKIQTQDSTNQIFKQNYKNNKNIISLGLQNSIPKILSEEDLKNKKNLDKLPSSSKKSFLKLNQIQFFEKQQKDQQQINLEDAKRRKKQIFYLSVRKALQEVTGQHTGQAILYQLMESKFKNKNNQVMEKHMIDMKKEYVDDILYLNRFQEKLFKKFIILVIQDLNMVDQTQPEFEMLHSELIKLNVELCILIQNEHLSTKEDSKDSQKGQEKFQQISYFYCEQNLLLYLLNCRNSKYHNITPTIIEHF